MKRIFKYIICLSSILVLTSCSIDYQNKSVDEMNIFELNEYNEFLIVETEYLKNNITHLKDVSGDKNEDEIIALINEVNNEVIKANVMITNESKSFFHTTSVSSGSGTIINEDNEYYYILTNNHVIYSLGNKTLYYVYDYLNNEYQAQVLFNDPNYDMALLRCRKSKNILRTIKLADNDASKKDNIIAIGQPKNKRNTITFGEVLDYGKVNCENCNVKESNINYDCVFYDAVTTNGNSGGMLINYDYELVGVVTYGINDYTGKYMYGAGSPVSKVKEFFNLVKEYYEVGDKI